MTNFWMCYVEGRGTPRYAHDSVESARTEAERLVRLPDNNGCKVFVLKTIAIATTTKPVKWEIT